MSDKQRARIPKITQLQLLERSAKKAGLDTALLKKIGLGLLAAPFVIFLVHYARENDRAHEIAERQAIEDRAEAEDERMDAIAAAHKVAIGMHAAQCRDAWGAPISVTTTKTSAGISEEWVYPSGVLYLQNGILRVIQNSR